MKNLDDILSLITGNMKPEERRNAYSTVKNDSDSADLYKKAKITWALISSAKEMHEYQVEKSYQVLHARISAKPNSLRLKSYFRYAAVLVLVSSISALTFYLGKQNSVSPDPGIKYTSVVAAKGQISKVILPDSSVVWLNSESVLIYDNNYSYKNRNLSLSGQAFLEVRKNINLPLVLSSGDLKVKVLGTCFDVCAYPEENSVKVFLESGKVQLLNAADNSFDYSLTPGEMAEYDSQSGRIEIRTDEFRNYINWKDGALIFVDTPMAEVLKSLERKFDVKIEVGNPKVYKSVLNANFKNESLKEILDCIQFSCSINYQLISEKGTTQAKVMLN